MRKACQQEAYRREPLPTACNGFLCPVCGEFYSQHDQALNCRDSHAPKEPPLVLVGPGGDYLRTWPEEVN